MTVNAGDFPALATQVRDHPGLILLPSLPPAKTGRLFRHAVAAADRAFRTPGGVVQIDAAGRVRHAGPG